MSTNSEIDDYDGSSSLPFDDGASSSSEIDEHDQDPHLALDHIAKSHKVTYPLRGNYTKWPVHAAFRELVQNWRDAIIKSYNLKEANFRVEREVKSRGHNIEIIYRVPRCGAEISEDWLGYIRFTGRDGAGTIEITNRSANLRTEHLDFGGTTKQEDENQAGSHGEGLKLAAVVLMRRKHNHHIIGCSSGFKWNFSFTKLGHLQVKLTRMKPEAIFKAKDSTRGRMRGSLIPFAFMPDKDVQFIIGQRFINRDDGGVMVKRRSIQLEDFESWTKVALFLSDPPPPRGSMISTKHGDLLAAENLRGKIYLKGLLLHSASMTRKPLKFGYNFARGHTNRDRQSVTDASDESSAIWQILEEALPGNLELIRELSNLLNTREEFADIISAKYCSYDTACLLRGYLFRGEFANHWYYSGEDNQRLHYIIEGLGRDGFELHQRYWTLLRSHGLLWTAEEEEQRRFRAAPYVPVPETTFATSVSRLLRACIRACPQTTEMAMSFVQAGQLHLQLSFSEDEQLFRIHERWLRMDTAINELALDDDLEEINIVWYTVKSLFSDALEQLPRQWFVAEDKVKTSEWQRKLEILRAEQRLEDDQEYFFVLVTPKDAKSFVNVSNTKRCDSTYSPSALLSNEDRANLFSLGAQLAELNILEIDRWYEAVDTSNVRAVIGIKKGERHLSGEPRKRRRMGFDA
ncbi:hypothetical protein J7T55_000958 [Diaporthe amygdali]|uniref:uncharacterized protein n=1 Tax=Phomopsis amygdali TaxID=1214568 RepID=UPI0022FF43F5|nr:uncharacterized protein J7T55_000958 [Diaporthe amygdali]KAJ0120105.1 hypothetical protein J7T55_000958 [Diaporthe amygdali]